MRLRLLCLLSCVLPTVSLAQDEEEVPPDADAPGCADYPDVPRFPGYWLSGCEVKEYDEKVVYVGTNQDGDAVTKTVGGKVISLDYVKGRKSRTASTVELLKNYENAFKKAGGEKTWGNPASATEYLKLSKGNRTRWTQVDVWSDGESYQLAIVEEQAMKQQVEVSASEMLSALERDGFIALRGIEFDTGKAVIRPASEALLAEIVTLLTGNPKLKLSVQGHTDNVGAPKANLELSRARAKAVREWLVSKRIAAGRLTSEGFGDTRPVGDNRTETGRAQNRRVELVKQ